jgi:glutamate-ammonia-ligase adenylyltransferase
MVDAAVRGWHHGRCRAMRSPRARELLTELMPLLLKAIAEAPDPDGAFVTFDRFLSGLPAGVQLFSMFHARPELLKLVVHVMGVAPGLATTLARRPSVLESVLAADFFREPPSATDLQTELDGALSRARDPEEVLDASRRWAAERNFQVGMLSLNRLIGTGEAQIAWSNVADAAVRALLPRVEADFADIHGRVAGCDLAVVAMGKLGSREMTVGSDLDLIFVYTTPEAEAASDGPRPLPASQYFARLCQRFINALTAPTAEGRLYEVDMRLRPSGKAGPIAASLASYQRYHRDDSWTWEQMALTRARVIAGPPPLTAEIERSIRTALTRRRDDERLRAEVADMRARIERERHARSIWDVKYVRGGLVDIEFIAQYLQLRHAHAAPQVLSTNTTEALSALSAAGVLSPDVADELIEALGLWQQIQARLRLAFSDPAAAYGEEGAKVLREVFRDVAGPDIGALTRRMETAATATLARFREIVGDADLAAEPAPGRAEARGFLRLL